jgi:hypothetical protein
VNLNILANYNDPDLTKLITTLFKILADTPVEDITSYIKRMKTIYEGLEQLSSNAFKLLLRMDPPLFTKVLTLINEGIQSLDLSVTINCYNFVTFPRLSL